MVQEQYEQLLEVAHECMVACNYSYDQSFKKGDVQMLANCIQLNRECADICSYLEQAISRGSAYVLELATLSATICEACAEECEKHNDDYHQQCAIASTNCAKVCRSIA